MLITLMSSLKLLNYILLEVASNKIRKTVIAVPKMYSLQASLDFTSSSFKADNKIFF